MDWLERDAIVKIGVEGSVVRGIIGLVVDEDVEEGFLVGLPERLVERVQGNRGRRALGGGTSAWGWGGCSWGDLVQGDLDILSGDGLGS